MKDVQRVEWARKLVLDQIARLNELRNANPRDPGFKLWRQTTLTIIQRIWPGDLARSERFRRIPFSPNSTKTSRTQVKEHYERGCAEAASYLKTLMSEIEGQGVQPASGAVASRPMRLPADLMGEAPTAEDQSDEPADPRDMFEPSPFGRFKPPPPSSEDEPGTDANTDFEFDRPVFQPPPDPHPAEPEPPAPPRPKPAASAAKSAPPPPRPAPIPAAPEPHQEPLPPVHTDRRALKEMLGFVDEPRSTPAATPTRPPAPAARPPAPTPRPAAPPPTAASPPVARPAPAHPPVEDDAFVPPRPAPSFAMADDVIREGDEELLGGDDATDEQPIEARSPVVEPETPQIDFLSRVFAKPTPRVEPPAAPAPRAAAPPPQAAPAPRAAAPPPAAPAPRAPAPPSRPAPAAVPAPEPARIEAHGNPASAAFAAIAGEVARLGVPEGQRAAARAALLDMARRIEDGSASWDTVCQILNMSAAYPAVARRVVPLLVPFLELE